MGALASGGLVVLDTGVVQRLGIGRNQLEAVVSREAEELRRREAAYDGRLDPHELQGKTVILIDDGLATGSTMRAAALAVRDLDPAKIVVAVPVASQETCDAFRDVVDEIVCEMTPQPFNAVGLWYEDFSQTTDEEVRALLERAEAGR